MSKHNSYDPEAERTCRGCHKILKTKEGILEGKYKFTCSPCHTWYRKREYWLTGLGIGFFVLVLIGVIWFVLKNSDD